MKAKRTEGLVSESWSIKIYGFAEEKAEGSSESAWESNLELSVGSARAEGPRLASLADAALAIVFNSSPGLVLIKSRAR